jgi:hypothetical protein
MYRLTVRFSDQRPIVVRSMSSSVVGLRIRTTVVRYAWRPMAEPTIDDVDALVGPATPQFAYQIRARVRELVAELPDEHPVRTYAEGQEELLDRLGFASTKAENSEPESRERIGWETIPSSAPASDPLPRGDR